MHVIELPVHTFFPNYSDLFNESTTNCRDRKERGFVSYNPLESSLFINPISFFVMSKVIVRQSNLRLRFFTVSGNSSMIEFEFGNFCSTRTSEVIGSILVFSNETISKLFLFLEIL